MQKAMASTVTGAVLVTFFIGLSGSSQALAQYGVQGFVKMGYDNQEHERIEPPTAGQASLEDELIGDGTGGTHGGEARYVVDIAQALIRSNTESYYYSTASTDSQAMGQFWETLTVTVSAGNYPEGVNFVTTGFLRGTLERTLRGGSKAL